MSAKMNTIAKLSLLSLGLGTLLGCKEEATVLHAEIQKTPMAQVPVVAPAPTAQIPGGGENSKMGLGAVIEGVQTLEAQEPPPGLHVEVKADASGKQVLHVSEGGKLLALRQGENRAVGLGRVHLILDENSPAPVIWERTDLSKDLETIRGIARLSPGLPMLKVAEKPLDVGEERKGCHFCRAIGDGAGGFSVLCQVNAQVSAANLKRNEEPGQRVFVQVGTPSYVRLDLPMAEGGVQAMALGYAYSGMGLVLRAESSWVSGESKASLAMASAERTQPVGFARMPHPRPHRIRPSLDLDFF